MNVTVAMQNAKSIKPLKYTTTNTFCPYGSFLVSVNGSNAPNFYWRLSINKMISQVGMDFTVLKAGAMVTWNLVPYKTASSADKDTGTEEISHQKWMQVLYQNNDTE